MKKRKRLTWKTGAKVVKAKAADKVVELKRTDTIYHCPSKRPPGLDGKETKHHAVYYRITDSTDTQP
ncbi:hypothetical protein QZH41_020712, partial [Actinostola sp. cb2023]